MNGDHGGSPVGVTKASVATGQRRHSADEIAVLALFNDDGVFAFHGS
ncbi:MAG: hypothetical protein ABI782_10740 [Anaerolineaceae bacterium]